MTVGIFWVIGNKIFAKKQSKKESKENALIIDSDYSHFKVWNSALANRFPLSDFATFPRGRVMFDKKLKEHILYIDKCITQSQAQKIAKFFSATKYRLASDEHYRCDNQGYLHFKVSEVLPVQNLIENLIWTLISDIPNRRNINQITMGLLFIQLLNHTDKLAYESREDRAIIEVLRYVEDNYKNGSLAEAAKLLHYDFYWLSHEIKNRTGRTYTEHLQEKRLSQSAFLLKNTTLSIEEVALAVGYENKSYFYRIFSNKYGTSPKKYRDVKISIFEGKSRKP